MSRNNRKTTKAPVVLAIIFGCLLAVIIVILFIANRFTLQLTLNGNVEDTCEYAMPYQDPGVSAVYEGAIFHSRDKKVDVTITGQVDENNLGEYVLTYTAEYEGRTVSKTRKVTVVDTTGPMILLKSDSSYYTLPGSTYVEEGYSAYDACDGDVTDKVVVKADEKKVVYTVTDSHGNTTTETREIVYDDRKAPEITLSQTTVNVPVGQSWNGVTYTAVDDLDGDVTDKVKVEGTVDTETAGTYDVKYIVTDSYGNTAEVVCTVNVVHGAGDISDVELGPKTVFLTFDDGPGQYTEELLGILNKYNVKVTFFVTNQFWGYQDLIGEMYRDGHTVAVHTNTHEYEDIYSSSEAFWADFNAMNDTIEEQTGQRSLIFRFPGGSSNRFGADGIMTQLTNEAEAWGYDYYDWNVLSGDAGDTQDSGEIYENVVWGMENRDVAVVLLHDIHRWTIDAIEDIIVYGLNNGYTFLPLTYKCYTCHHGVNN